MSAFDPVVPRSFLIGVVFSAALCSLAACDWAKPVSARIAHARAASADRDFGRAVIELKGIVSGHPNDGDARLALAEASFGAGDLESAAKELSRATDLKVPAERIEPLRWKIELAAGRDVVEPLSHPRPGLDERLRIRYLVQALLVVNRPAAALEQLQSSATTDDEGRLLQAQILALLGRSDEALRALDSLTKNPATAARAQGARAELFMRAGRPQDAEAALRAVVALSDLKHDRAGYLRATAVLAGFELSQGRLGDARTGIRILEKEAPGMPGTRLLSGRLALGERRLPVAIDDFSAIVSAVPTNVQARLLLATALTSAGQLGQAETQLNAVVTAQPSNRAARRFLADLQLRQGRADSALRTLERLEADGASDAATLLLVARAERANGDRAAALATLERVSSLDSPDPALKLELGRALIEAGLPERALGILGQGAPTSGGAGQTELLKLVALSAAKGAEAAKTEARNYAGLHAADAAAQTVAAVFFSSQRLPDLARPYFEAALKLAPGDPAALRGLAQLEASTGRFEAAEALLNRWLTVQPGSTDARGALAQVALAKGDAATAKGWLEKARASDPVAIEPRLQLARLYGLEGAVDAARKAAAEALALDPKGFGGLVTSAWVEERAKDSHKAIDLLRQATEVSPRAYEAWNELGRLYLSQSDWGAAKSAFAKALEARPGWWSAIDGLTVALTRSGDRQGVASTIIGLKDKPETRLQGFLLEGNVLASRGEFADAVSAYNKAIAIAPNPVVAVQRFRAQLAGRLPDAESQLRDWVGRRPEDAMVRMVLGEHLQSRGDLAGASRQFEEVIVRNPTDAVALNNLAWVYQLSHDPRAVETARRAVKIAPQEPAVADTLGWALLQSGNLAESLDWLKRASGAMPHQPEMDYHYAAALARSGNSVEAITLLSRALASAGSFPSRAEAVNLKSSLQSGTGRKL